MTKHQGNLPVTIWYGERGIVNSIVNHISTQPDPARAVEKLLNAVHWADSGKPVWLSAITKAHVIVEIGLANFGNPDIMIVCRVENEEKPYCVFLEAKAICYQFSMGDNCSGMSQGFNSTINGQLSLKYRFGKALGNSESGTERIVEPKELFEAYKAQLRDYSKKPRHLREQGILELFSALGLIGLNEDRCCYIALTWDDDQHAYFDDPDVSSKSSNLPLLLDESGNDVYDSVKPRLGWLGYQHLEAALDLRANHEYAQACRSMFSQPEPTPKDYHRLRYVPVTRLDNSDFLEDLFARFKDICGERADFFHKPLKGSYSLGVASKTLAKVIPEDNRVFVGVRVSDDTHADAHTFPEERSVQGVIFRGNSIRTDIDSIDADPHMEDVLRAFAKIVAQT